MLFASTFQFFQHYFVTIGGTHRLKYVLSENIISAAERRVGYDSVVVLMELYMTGLYLFYFYVRHYLIITMPSACQSPTILGVMIVGIPLLTLSVRSVKSFTLSCATQYLSKQIQLFY